MNEDKPDQSNEVGWARRTVDLVERYFGGALQHTGDIFADRIALWKLKNRLDVLKKADNLIVAAEIADARRIAERIGIPMIEAFETESDESLQDVWARLVRNAADPRKPASLVSRQLIDLVRNLEPIDLIVINKIFDADLETPVRKGTYLHWMASPFPELEMDELLVILDRLAALGLLAATTEGGVGFAANEEYRAPAQLIIGTPAGRYQSQHLLLVLKRALAK